MQLFKKYIGRISLAGIGVFSLLLVITFYKENCSFKIGEIIGSALFFTLVFSVLSVVLKKRLGIHFWKLVFFCFAVSYSVVAAYFILGHKSNPQPVVVLNELQAFGKKMASDMQKSSTDFLSVLTSAAISNEKSIVVVKERLVVCKNVLSTYEKAFVEKMVKAEKELQNVSDGKEFLEGFRDGQESCSKLFLEYVDFEKNALNRIEHILDFLSKKMGTFKVLNGMFVFDDIADYYTYQDLVQRLHNEAKNEEIVFQKLMNGFVVK